jgi:hypothetical protein
VEIFGRTMKLTGHHPASELDQVLVVRVRLVRVDRGELRLFAFAVSEVLRGALGSVESRSPERG